MCALERRVAAQSPYSEARRLIWIWDAGMNKGAAPRVGTQWIL